MWTPRSAHPAAHGGSSFGRHVLETHMRDGAMTALLLNELLLSAGHANSPWHWMQRCHAFGEHERLAEHLLLRLRPRHQWCRQPECGCSGGCCAAPTKLGKVHACMLWGIQAVDADDRGRVVGTSEMGPMAAAHSRKFSADHRAWIAAGLHGGRRNAAAARSTASSGCDAAAGSGLCAGLSKSVSSTSQKAHAAAGHKMQLWKLSGLRCQMEPSSVHPHA
jgi:hypothetical protein